MRAQNYFRLCLFVPLLVPLPFLVFKGDAGLSSMFMAQLVFGMPPYILVFVLPLLFLFGRMSERQIAMGIIFFPIVYPLVFGLFWSVAPNFITTMTITLSNTSQWVFTSIMFPAAYSMLFLSGNIIRKMLSGEMGLLEQWVSAVLSADIKTNNQSMDKDNKEIAKSVSDYQESLEQIINEHRGQRTNRASDNILVEFTSVLNAVKCGMSLQQKMKEINKELSAQDEIQLGIGINMGEVKSKGNDIRGHGVTVATQLEDMSQAGDICISGDVYDRIKKKLIFNYEYLGEKIFKEVDDPVRTYRLKLNGSISAASAINSDNKLIKIPDKPSIAVLPFDNMSSDPEQEYFSDGITEDILTDLSKLSGLFVISRHSTFVYKGKSVSAQQVSQDLGVRYVLEGSVRKSGNRIRISAQLIDAIFDDHVWAERFDRDLDDIFAVQDEVIKKIVAALALELTTTEKNQLDHKDTNNQEAHDCYLQALKQFYLYTKKSALRSRAWLANAIELDPDYAKAYALKARVHIYEYIVGLADSDHSLKPALELASKAIELAPELPQGHTILAWTYYWMGNNNKAITIGRYALSLDANDSECRYFLAIMLSITQHAEEAYHLLEEVKQLNPHYEKNVMILTAMGISLCNMQKYEEAIHILDKAHNANPNFIPRHLWYFVACLKLNRETDAKKAVREIMRVNPEYTLSNAEIFFGGGRINDLTAEYCTDALESYGVPVGA